MGRVSAGCRSVISRDSGPNCSGTRAQSPKGRVEFPAWSGWEVRLVDYPPSHRKSDPVERCRSSRERQWGGALRTCLEVALGSARRMTGKGPPPTVAHRAGAYRAGVRWTKAEMEPIEARLERSTVLPTYDITTRPRKTSGG